MTGTPSSECTLPLPEQGEDPPLHPRPAQISATQPQRSWRSKLVAKQRRQRLRLGFAPFASAPKVRARLYDLFSFTS